MYTVEHDADNDNLVTIYDWDGDEIYSAYLDEYIIVKDVHLNNTLRVVRVGDLTDSQLLAHLAAAEVISFS